MNVAGASHPVAQLSSRGAISGEHVGIDQAAPGQRLRALLHAFPEIGGARYPSLKFLSLLHEPGLDLAAPGQPPLSGEDRTALRELLEPDVVARVERMKDVRHHDIADWLETYWLPVTPRRELEVVSGWGHVFDEDLPDRHELPVTAAATYAVDDVFNRRTDYDEGVDHECHIEMRRLATKALRTQRAPTRDVEPVWELGTHGTGWHHGGQ